MVDAIIRGEDAAQAVLRVVLVAVAAREERLAVEQTNTGKASGPKIILRSPIVNRSVLGLRSRMFYCETALAVVVVIK